MVKTYIKRLLKHVISRINSSNKRKYKVIGRVKNRHFPRGYMITYCHLLRDDEFTRLFRIDRETFRDVLTKIEPYLPIINEQYAINSSGSMITNEMKLGMTLRWLAGGSYLDICAEYGVTSKSFYSKKGVLWPTLEALDKALVLSFPIDDDAELERLSEEFAEMSNGHFRFCVGAMDGLILRSRCPYESEVQFPKSYVNRKGCFGVLCLAVADLRGRFLSFSCNWSGSTHDSLAYSTSVLHTMIEVEKRLNRGLISYFLIGDDAFPCTEHMLTPYSGREWWEDSYNYHLSKCRQCVERAFGMLVKRFGILWRKLQTKFDTWALIATVCAKLHNLCVSRNVPIMNRGDHQPGDIELVVLNEDGPAGVRARGTRRTNIINSFRTAGRRRPTLRRRHN